MKNPLPRHFRSFIAIAAAASACLTSPAARADVVIPASAPASRPAAPVYRISSFAITYASDRPNLPDLKPLADLPLTLARNPAGVIVAPGEGDPFSTTLAQLQAQPADYSWTGVQAVCRHVIRYLNDRDVIGVYVGPTDAAIAVDIDPTGMAVGGKDLRSDAVMPIVVRTAQVSAVRAVYSGHGLEKPRIGGPGDRIVDGSPLRPAADSARGDLLTKQPLDDYVALLNRHPGRRVDVALSSGTNPDAGDVTLDYLVQQQKPWQAYFALSNTGTQNTSPWRQRFGFTHNQLTGNDDILNFDYSTASFENSHTLSLSYDAPFFASQRVRWNAAATYSHYSSSDVGLGNLNISGDQFFLTGGINANVYQSGQLFVDLLLGVRFANISSDQQSTVVRGSSPFFTPFVGVQAQRVRPLDSAFATVTLEGTVSGESTASLAALGRSNVQRSWATVKWSAGYSFYLEPLLTPDEFAKADFEDPAKSSRFATLAHEIALSTRGQYTFNSRTPAQFQDVLGGFYSVRGYEESESAGDATILGSAEYRWHIPRSFTPGRDPASSLFGQPFRVTPEVPYGNADWDLIFRTFLDAGFTATAARSSSERNETLVGAGIGLELVIKSNLSLRADWGVALKDTARTKAGHSRLHFGLLLTY